MYTFGTRSMERLLTVREDLRKVAFGVLRLQVIDFAIIHGWRGKEAQNEAYMLGNSDKQWPESKHNVIDPNGDPMSDALDFAPWCLLPNGRYGIPWDDTHSFAILGGMFIAIGASVGVHIRYGGDWDADGLTTDQKLMDWGHVEIK